VRLRDIGEFGLIDRIERAVRRAGRADAVVLGIGDDAALLRLRAGEDLAVSTDAFAEGVHFRFANEAPRAIGRRALAAALSDLAAMGARPIGVLAALAAPPALPVGTAEGITRGLLEGARRWHAPLVGGNVTRATQTSLTLTVLGAVRRGRALTRDDARPGDRLFVTGTLGGAALAVAKAERGTRMRFAPEPRLAAGQALARLAAVGACIDVSDGLVADLGHLLRASGVGADLDPARVPNPAGFAAACARVGADPLRLTLAGGEDYELLFTLRSGATAASSLRRRLGVAVTEIGTITRKRGLRGLSGGARRGFTHF
jgi:thiamine-monophosphate kinase